LEEGSAPLRGQRLGGSAGGDQRRWRGSHYYFSENGKDVGLWVLVVPEAICRRGATTRRGAASLYGSWCWARCCSWASYFLASCEVAARRAPKTRVLDRKGETRPHSKMNKPPVMAGTPPLGPQPGGRKAAMVPEKPQPRPNSPRPKARGRSTAGRRRRQPHG
jgi:hypothetical protein